MPISLPHQSIGFDFASDLSLPTLKGIGLQYVDTHNYFWDNCTRKDNLCLIQYTLKGEGAIKIDNIFYTLKPNDAFLIDNWVRYEDSNSSYFCHVGLNDAGDYFYDHTFAFIHKFLFPNA